MATLNRKIWLLLVLMALLACTACGDILDLGGDDSKDDDTTDTDTLVCDNYNVTCNHTLDVELLLPGGEAFEIGDYTIKVKTLDGSVYQIFCYLYNQEDDFECSGSNLDSLDFMLTNEPDVAILGMAGAPPTCQMIVEFNGYEILNRTIVPEYDLSYPNGEGCKPTCYNGTESVAVSLR